MVDWHDPNTFSNEAKMTLKLEHALGGLCIWEFISQLDFDFRLLFGERDLPSHGWAKWIYLGARVLLLASFVNIFAFIDAPKGLSCSVQIKLNYTLPCLAAEMATALIAFRVFAIWNRNPYLGGLMILCFAGQLVAIVHTIVIIESKWNATMELCWIVDYDQTLTISVTLLAVDLLLVMLMLVGLFRLREAGARQNFWRLLWRQGWLWLALAPLAGAPPTVFLLLNLNRWMDTMFLAPQMIIPVIGATRMFRSLTEFHRHVQPDPLPIAGGYTHCNPLARAPSLWMYFRSPVNLSTVVSVANTPQPSYTSSRRLDGSVN